MRKRLLFILLGCLAVFALAVGSTIWWATSYMRKPIFRQELAQMVQEATGREVQLAGDLTISIFPWFGLKAEGVSLGNDPAFGPTPLLAARTISAHIKVLPLFKKHLVFDTVELDEAALVLTMDHEGRGNWEGLMEHLSAQENATDRADTFFHKITVRGVRLMNSQARLDDFQHNHSYITTALDLRTGRMESGKGLPFAVSTDFFWPRPELTAHLEGTGKLHWSKTDPEPLLTETKVQGEIGGTFMPKSAPKAGISTTLTVENGGKDLKLSDVRLRLIGANITGEITFFDVTDMFRLGARLQLGRFSPRHVINAYWPGTVAHDHQGALATAEGPLNISADVNQLVFETPGLSADNARFKGKVRMGFDDDTVSGLDFDLTADKLDVDADIAALTSNATSTPVVVGDLPMTYLCRVKGAGHIKAETLKLAGVTGQGAEIVWQAAGGAHKMQLKQLKAQGGTIAADISGSFGGGKPPLRPTADLPSPTVLGWSGNLRMDGVDARQVSWLNKAGVAATGRMDLRVKAEAKPAPAPANAQLGVIARRAAGEFTAALGASQLDISPDAGQAKTQPRHMQFSSLQAQAHFAPVPIGTAEWAVQLDGGFSAVGTKPLLNLDAKVSGLLRSQQGKVTLNGAAASARLKGWFLPKRENEASFSGKGSMDFAAQSLSLTAATVQTCGLTLSGPMAGSKVFGAGYSLSGHLRCPDGDPKRVLSALEVNVPKASDKRTLQRVSGEADMVLNAKGLALTNIAAQLDDMPLRGSYSVQNFDEPRHTVSLAGGNFDLDRYLPAPEPPKRGVKQERPAPEALPVESLRALNLDGNFALRSFKYRGLTTRDFKTTVSAHGGSLLMKPLGGNFYGGTLSGEFSAQVVAGGMQTRLALAAKDFQAGPFMLGWAGKEVVTGKTDLFLDLTGVGTTDTEVLRTLEGLGSFKIVNGSYVTSGGNSGSSAAPGQPNAQLAGNRHSTVVPQSSAPVKRPGSQFSQASARLKVKQGVFASEDFRMDGASMVVTGKGRFSPADDTINVSLVANMTGMPDVPIRVFGRLKDPEMEISTGALIGNTIKEILGIPLRPIKFFKDLLF
jgi:AsmA protein